MSAFNVTVSIPEPDLIIAGDSPYAPFAGAYVQLYRWTTEALARAGSAAAGSLIKTWTLIAQSEPITDDEGPYSFAFYDSGVLSTDWYRYRIGNAALSTYSEWSDPWQATNAGKVNLRDIVLAAGRVMGQSVFQGTVVTGDTDTVGCPLLFKSTARSDSIFDGNYLGIVYDVGGARAAPEGEERIIASVDVSTGSVELDYALTAAVAAGDRFLVSNFISFDEWKQAVAEARENMLMLRTADIPLRRGVRKYPVPIGVKSEADIFEVLGVLPGDYGDDWPVYFNVESEGPQLYIRLRSDSDGLNFVRLRYLQSYRDYEGILSNWDDTTVASIEWLRYAVAYQAIQSLQDADPNEPEFGSIRASMEEKVRKATAKYAPKLPGRRAKIPRDGLVGPDPVR